MLFPLAPVYKRKRIDFIQAAATEIHPYGDVKDSQGFVTFSRTEPGREGEIGTQRFDYLINATGPRLKFDATPGLGPETNTVSVCTAEHAVHAAAALDDVIQDMRAGQDRTLVIGTGHGTCTCQGAAFEYIFNVEQKVRKAGVRDRARIIYLTNEAALGDFGVNGMVFDQQGYETTSEMWTESLFRERGIEAIVGAAVSRVDKHKIHFETLDGNLHELDFDFSMLIPPFGGQPLKAFDATGADITEQLFAPSGLMKVDADYTPKPFEQWKASDWPQTYEVPGFDNIFAAGIAFAPPHQISKPRKTPNGTVIAPAPPRTGMPSGTIGKAVAETIAKRLKNSGAKAVKASMADMGAACVASAGTGMTRGSAAAMTMMPVVPDFDRYPTGRDLSATKGELGLHGHWMKLLLHYLFIYKAKALPGWQFIPE